MCVLLCILVVCYLGDRYTYTPWYSIAVYFVHIYMYMIIYTETRK